MKYDYVIIGGGIAGTTAAETIREHDHSARILMIMNEATPLYSRVLLPNYVKERIVRDQVFLRKTPDYDHKNISVFFGEEAGTLEVRKNEVLLQNGARIAFGKLLIATGGTPRPWAVRGREFGTMYRMQTIEDADAILRDIKQAKHAVVVGGGFIALEFLETFFVHKVATTLVTRGAGVFDGILDDDGQRLMAAVFNSHNIALAAEDEPEALLEGDSKNSRRMMTRKNRVLPFDMIGLGIGIERNLDLAKGAGITTGERGIITDEYLETDAPGVFAAGDVAEYYDTIFDTHRIAGNWTNAFLQGKTAGLNMIGKKTPFRNLNFYSITNLGLHITIMGVTIEEEPNTHAISRIDEKSLRYERFFFKENRLIGAAIINMFKDKLAIGRLIEGRIPLEVSSMNFGNMAFDLNSILI